MVLIDAVYINKSGGKILLQYLINYIIKKNHNNFYFLLDDRISLDSLKNLNYQFIQASENSRKMYYNNNIIKFSSVFCFANIPPPISIENKLVSIYFHNKLLLDFTNSNLNFFQKLNFLLKKIYIKYINSHNYIWILQTENIANLIVKELKINLNNVKIIPFFDVNLFHNCNLLEKENYNNYLYVADSSSQKNHLRLLIAWKLFIDSQNNNKLTLHLTLSDSSSPELLLEIKRLQSLGYQIINHKHCSISKIFDLYKNCNFLIYPSLAESFGLPLIEAASAGCKVISSDLPYVYDVISPSLVFNPKDIQSILKSLLLSLDYTNIKPTSLIVKSDINNLINTIKYV